MQNQLKNIEIIYLHLNIKICFSLELLFDIIIPVQLYLKEEVILEKLIIEHSNFKICYVL
jgi:hypothetical protein